MIYSFLFRCRPQPTPTLFPYTTLFRSSDSESSRRTVISISLAGDPRPAPILPHRGRPPGHRRPDTPVRRTKRLSDRKSTRLNSSHTVISYAVFSLKKKRRDYSRREARQ